MQAEGFHEGGVEEGEGVEGLRGREKGWRCCWWGVVVQVQGRGEGEEFVAESRLEVRVQGELVEEVAQGDAARFVPGGPVVLQFRGDLQVLRVGERVLEGGLVDLVVDDRSGGGFLVGEFGGAGLLGRFGAGEGPIFDVVGGCLDELGFDDGAEFLDEGLQARELADPETVGAPALVGDEELSSGRRVLGEVGPILEAEDEGADEVHGDCMVQVEHFDGRLVDGSGIQEGQQAGEYDCLGNLVQLW